MAFFYFDVACPFAFMASLRVEEIAQRTDQVITWTPSLLGGLYDMTNAIQGKSGSAMDVPMAASKRVILNSDFKLQIARTGVKGFKTPASHPMRTVEAMRLLCAVPTYCRARVALALFNAYWVLNLDMTSRQVLLRVANAAIAPLPFVYTESVFTDSVNATKLRENTQEAFNHGAFGVPTFIVPSRGKMFFGSDRMALLEAELLSITHQIAVEDLGNIQQLYPRVIRGKLNTPKTINCWFDFSSPWSYFGWTQLERLQSELGGNLTINLRPFLLGALFREIGTAMLPSDPKGASNKSVYQQQDVQNTVQFLNGINKSQKPRVEAVDLYWTDHFPLRSVTALRISLLEPKVIPVIYRAAWKKNLNIADDSVLVSILDAAGFNGPSLLAEVTSGPRAAEIKQQLISNTNEAIEKGVCGAPTFEVVDVNGEIRLCWGQDRMNVLEDLLLGWNPEISKEKATVGKFVLQNSSARL